MKRFATTVLAALVVTFAATSAHAQASRTWVSGVGDDVNPCSRTAPCKTFAGAISKTATHGEISVLDPGGFGSVTITKSITINGTGVLAGITASLSVDGININITNALDPKVVVLRGLELNGIGTGDVGIQVFSAGTTVVVDRVTVQGFATGVLTTGTATAANVTVSNSTITDNRAFGVRALEGTIAVLDSRLVSNQVAVQADMGVVRLSNNDVMNNKTGFGCGLGVLSSAGNNRKAGNVGGGVPACVPTLAITVQ